MEVRCFELQDWVLPHEMIVHLACPRCHAATAGSKGGAATYVPGDRPAPGRLALPEPVWAAFSTT
jgi:hypothetical protein